MAKEKLQITAPKHNEHYSDLAKLINVYKPSAYLCMCQILPC
jgi:hypothetical protein